MRVLPLVLACLARVVLGRRLSDSLDENYGDSQKALAQLVLALSHPVASWQVTSGKPLAPLSTLPLQMSGRRVGTSMLLNDASEKVRLAELTRRMTLPLPLLVLLPQVAAADNTGFYGEKTEFERRAEQFGIIDKATKAGFGLDEERRGKFNEKALFSDDYYYRTGLRPSPEQIMANKQLPFANKQAELPYVVDRDRQAGFRSYGSRVQMLISEYDTTLKSAIVDKKWEEVKGLLERGQKGTKQIPGVPESPIRGGMRAFGLMANKFLIPRDANDIGAANLFLRLEVNEAYFAMDDIVTAAQAGDAAEAKKAYLAGRAFLNVAVKIINLAITEGSGMGTKLPLISADGI